MCGAFVDESGGATTEGATGILPVKGRAFPLVLEHSQECYGKDINFDVDRMRNLLEVGARLGVWVRYQNIHCNTAKNTPTPMAQNHGRL